jgi:hypothetical protein
MEKLWTKLRRIGGFLDKWWTGPGGTCRFMEERWTSEQQADSWSSRQQARADSRIQRQVVDKA